jgi:ribosome-associated translation inhibitor RaiA
MEDCMASDTRVEIHFKDLEQDDDVREHLHDRCTHLAEEFPETTDFELTLQESALAIECHAHVSGKRTSIAAHSNGAETPRQAGDQALDKVERELRKAHDKRIFTPRREAQKNRAKRNV